MSKRLTLFKSLEFHPWLGRLYKTLTKSDIIKAEAFIEENDQCSKGDFEMLINRMFLDSKNKPKRWKEISELLSSCNY